MPFRRNYDYEATFEQKQNFIEHIKGSVDRVGYCLVKNDYPYNMFHDKEVKTDHRTLRYSESDFYRVHYIVDRHRANGYTIIENGSDARSIEEIRHIHFIKLA